MEERKATSISILPRIKSAAALLAKQGKWRTFSAFAEEAVQEKMERENKKPAN